MILLIREICIRDIGIQEIGFWDNGFQENGCFGKRSSSENWDSENDFGKRYIRENGFYFTCDN